MLRPEKPKVERPISMNKIEVINSISNHIESGKDLTLDQLRANLTIVFTDISAIDLELYENRSEAKQQSIKSLYEDLFIMLKECKQTDLTPETFNLLANKYDMPPIDIILDSTTDHQPAQTNLTDVLITVLSITFFTGVISYIALTNLVPTFLPKLDTMYIPYIVALTCLIISSIQVTGFLSKDFKEYKRYKTFIESKVNQQK